MIHPKTQGSGMESIDMPTYFQTKFRNSSDISSTPKRYGKRIVEEKIGNSYESPSYFRTEHGKLSSTTYNNPFINMPVNPASPPLGTLKNTQTCNVLKPIRKEQFKEIFNIKEIQAPSGYNMLTHQKMKSEKVVLQINERPKFNEDYDKLSRTTASPFHLKANYFTDFAQRNDMMNVFGGINQRERPTEFFKVKNFALDPQHQELQRTIRLNSQPSLMRRTHNTSYNNNTLTPRSPSKDNTTMYTSNTPNNRYSNSMEFQILGSQTPKISRFFGSPKSCNNSFGKLNSYSESNQFTPSYSEHAGSPSSSQQGKINLRVDTLNGEQQGFENKTTLSTNGFHSPLNTGQNSLQQTKSRFYGGRDGSFNQPNRHKVSSLMKLEPMKVKVDKKQSLIKQNQEEESADELKNIAEFEHHLKFIQGSNFTNNTQGSVFFRDQKKVLQNN